jgi:hypothetical protein
MKLFCLLFILISAFSVFAQTNKLVLEENIPNILAEKIRKVDISAEDWTKLESALALEDWTKTSVLAEEYLKQLDTETKDGKRARLRYIYLYALAGKVISYSFSGDRDMEISARNRLDEAAKAFVGEEFIFPVRKILGNCKGVVNYVCDSSDNAGYLRIAATNLSGTSILFTEYIEMRRVKLDVKRFDKADVVLGGRLKGVRLNPKRSNLLVMTLQFEDGFVDKIYPVKTDNR